MRPDFSEFLSKYDPHKRHLAMNQQILPFASMNDLPAEVQDVIAGLSNSQPVSYLFYDGGTLGMKKFKATFHSKNEFIYRPASNADELLSALVVKGLKEMVQVVWIPLFPEPIDSTNGRRIHWQSMANCIRLIHRYEFEHGHGRIWGGVPLGGTDTKAQKLAAQTITFPNIGIPLIGTGAQVPIEERGDDGTNNLYFAICGSVANLSGVLLLFDNLLMEGAFAHKIQDRQRRAFVTQQQYVRGIVDSELQIFPSAQKRNAMITPDRLKFQPGLREGINVVKLSPATPSESLMHMVMDPTCDATLLITYGAGNVRDKKVIQQGFVEDDDGDKIGGLEHTHIDILKACADVGYPVVLGSPMIDGRVDSQYECGALAVSPDGGNAISGGPVTGPLLEVKMMKALWEAMGDGSELDYKKFREVMETDLIGEMSSFR